MSPNVRSPCGRSRAGSFAAMLVRGTTKNYNVVFLALLRRVRDAAKERGGHALGQDVVDFLAGLIGESQAWPRAAEVVASLRSLPAYTVLPRSRLRMLLEALEQAMYTGLTEKVVLTTDLTIEHVLPQEWATNWPLPEGADPFQARLDRDAAKHRLGNLTLVTDKLNPKMSNAGWIDKREALRQYSVMRISTDIRNAETWDEAAIAERGERLASAAGDLWTRPNDEVSAGGADDNPAPVSATPVLIGPPDPENPTAFSSPLSIADEIGIGRELRHIIATSRELGLHPRPDRNSVMVSPPADRRFYLFTVWPQWDHGGSFKLWKSPAAFAKWLPGVELDAARAALGGSEDAGVLLAHDTDAFVGLLRRLVPVRELSQKLVDQRDHLVALGVAGADKVPHDVLRVIDLRAPGAPDLALRFAAGAIGLDGAFLRSQQGKGDPWYFQVRHPAISQVVAYVNVRPSDLRIEYRLPGTHETYGVGVAREQGYGIVVKLEDEADLETALRLLADALAKRD